MAGSETTRSPRPKETGATYMRLTPGSPPTRASAPRVVGHVVDLQHRERKPAFGALVAAATVPPCLRIDARQRMPQSETPTQLQHVGLRQRRERGDYFERVRHTTSHERR